MGLPQGISISLASSLVDLEKVFFYKIDDGYDRRGRIATFTFKKYPNHDYQENVTITSVRAIVALLAPHFTLMDINEYRYDEQNDCWIFSRPTEEKFTVTVNHKYWTDKQIFTFKKIVLALAYLYDAEVEDNSNY